MDELMWEDEDSISSEIDSLSKTNKYLVTISACLAAAKYKQLKTLLSEAYNNKVSPARIYEVLLQSYLFLGYPKALEGIKIFREIIEDNSRESQIKYNFSNWPDWKTRGRDLCEKVYGKNFDKLVQRIGEISPELSEWMIVEGYGKVLSRGILSGAIRELCTVAALTVTSDVNQLHSHLRGAKNLGASKTEIAESIQVASKSLLPYQISSLWRCGAGCSLTIYLQNESITALNNSNPGSGYLYTNCTSAIYFDHLDLSPRTISFKNI